MNRRVFQKLATDRLEDARALLRAKRFDAAYYMAGYVIECALKACICKSIPRYSFPAKDSQKYYVHNLEKLIGAAADLKIRFEAELARDALLARYWNLVKDWNEESRYETRGRNAAQVAKDIVQGITDPDHGVLKCLSKYW